MSNQNEDGAPTQQKNYITPKGFEKLREELRTLLYEERPKLLQVIAWAAGNGDRSENGDYIYGKRRLREIDRRVHFINHRLDLAQVVDPSAHPKSDRILFGARVTVEDSEGQCKVYRIVGIDEVDPEAGDISWISPIGKALLGKKSLDEITVELPRGTEEFVIVSFKYDP